MKKMILTGIMLGLSVLYISCYSQETQNSETKTSSSSINFSYGINLGATFSAFTHNAQPFTGKKAGLMVGGFAEYQIFDYLGVSLEPGYIQKGALVVDPLFLYDDMLVYDPYWVVEVSSITSHHIQIPLVVTLRIPGNECSATPFINIGASATYNFYTSGNNLVDYGLLNGKNYYETVKDEITEKFKDFQYQALTGLGVEFNTSSGNIIFNLRYFIGLSKINNYSYQDQLYDFSSNSWVISMGYRFK